MRTTVRHLAPLLALTAAGCSALVDPGKSDPLKSAEGFCNSLQDVANDLACGVLLSLPAMTIPIQSQAATEQAFEAYRGRCDVLQAEVDAGRYGYDQGAAEGCIEALEARGCRGMNGDYFAWPAECARALKGAIAEGGACLHEVTGSATVQGATKFRLSECTEGTSCVGWGAPPACGTVTCRPPATLGTECQTEARPQGCAAGLYCDGSQCLPAHTDPVACTANPAICDPRSTACDFSTTGMCQTLPTDGMPCATFGAPCAPGLLCDYYAAPNACIPKPAAPLAEGGHCVNTSWCADGLYCDTASTRTCLRQRSSGLCTIGDECASGYACVFGPLEGTCTPLPDLGGPCSSGTMGAQCRSGLYCNAPVPGTGQCVLPPGQGQTCMGPATTTGGCAPGLRPVGSTPCTCQPFLGEGEACAMHDECGYYWGTGRQCVYDSAKAANVCKTITCNVAVGWFATGSMF